MDLASTGPAGVYLRFVRRHTGRDDLFATHGSAVVGAGAPAGVFVAMDTWLFGSDPADAAVLWDRVWRGPPPTALYYAAAGPAPEAPPGWDRGDDQVLVTHPSAGPAPTLVSGPALLEARGQLHPALTSHVPPPALVSRLPFRLHGLLRDDRIVALADTTVDDGDTVAISQVHTAPELRGQGLGAELVAGVLAELHALGRGAAVWLCDADHAASLALARRAGFVPLRRVPRYEPA